MSPDVINKSGLQGYELLVVESKPKYEVLQVRLKDEPKCCPCCSSKQLRSKGRYLRRAGHLDL